MTDPKNALEAAKLPEARAVKVKGAKRARLSREMKQALELMAYEGIDIKEAAKRVEMNTTAALAAWRRPAVKASYNQLCKEIRDNGAQQAYLRIVHMSQNAKSESVKLDANKFVAGVDGIAPVRRVEARHQVSHSFGNFSYDDIEAVDVTPDDNQSDD